MKYCSGGLDSRSGGDYLLNNNAEAVLGSLKAKFRNQKF